MATERAYFRLEDLIRLQDRLKELPGMNMLLMAKKPNRDPKSRALQQEGSLHPHP